MCWKHFCTFREPTQKDTNNNDRRQIIKNSVCSPVLSPCCVQSEFLFSPFFFKLVQFLAVCVPSCAVVSIVSPVSTCFLWKVLRCIAIIVVASHQRGSSEKKHTHTTTKRNVNQKMGVFVCAIRTIKFFGISCYDRNCEHVICKRIRNKMAIIRFNEVYECMYQELDMAMQAPTNKNEREQSKKRHQRWEERKQSQALEVLQLTIFR